jgi:capsular polysaccharide transport system ATP-binding protein
MIALERVTKTYKTHSGHNAVLSDVSCEFPEGCNVGVLGMNGAGKSTLLRLLSGAEPPDSGVIRRNGRVSFPLGFAGTFHPDLTGRQNAIFVARVFGENVQRVVDFVWDFSELGAYFDMPIRTYSSGMSAKLAFGVSLAIDFDVYLIDEVTEVGDARFRQKCVSVFSERMVDSDIVMVSHNTHTLRAYCDRGAVLAHGRLTFFDTIEQAFHAYREIAGTDV